MEISVHNSYNVQTTRIKHCTKNYFLLNLSTLHFLNYMYMYPWSLFGKSILSIWCQPVCRSMVRMWNSQDLYLWQMLKRQGKKLDDEMKIETTKYWQKFITMLKKWCTYIHNENTKQIIKIEFIEYKTHVSQWQWNICTACTV